MKVCCVYSGSMQWRRGLRHCATRRKVAGSIPDGVIEFLIALILNAGVNLYSKMSRG